MIARAKRSSKQWTGRDYLAHEVYGVEESAYYGPPLPCYVPPSPAVEEVVADLHATVAHLRRELAKALRARGATK